jgi:hypothetical protein
VVEDKERERLSFPKAAVVVQVTAERHCTSMVEPVLGVYPCRCLRFPKVTPRLGASRPPHGTIARARFRQETQARNKPGLQVHVRFPGNNCTAPRFRPIHRRLLGRLLRASIHELLP